MRRNSSIELAKLFFAISIALGHFSRSILPDGIIVTLFFALSGYFLVSSFDSKKYSNAWKYSMNRVKRIYPYYLFAFTVLFIYVCLKGKQTLYGIVASFLTSLPEILMVQNIGVFSGGINYPLWQLCTLIVASHIMFALLHWNKDATTNIICPIIAIATFTYLSNAFGSVEPDWWGVEYNFIYIPLLRAVGSLSIGMFLNYPIKKALHYLENSNISFLPVVMSIVSVVALVAFWFNRSSYASVFPFALLLICMFYSKGFFARAFQLPLFSKLDKLSLALYLNHAFIIHLFQDYSHFLPRISSHWIDILYLIVLIIYSIIMLLVVNLLMTCIKRLARVIIHGQAS